MLRLICIMLLCVQSVAAQQANVNRSLETIFSHNDLAVLSNPSDAKLKIQIAYGLKMAQQVISYLTVYEIKNNMPVSVEEFQLFSDVLLASDPFIQCIEYRPQQILRLTFQENARLVPQLNGLKFTYQYEVEAGLWRFSQYEYAATEELEINADTETNITDNTSHSTVDDSLPIDTLPETLVPEAGIEISGVTTPYHLDVLYAYGVITHHCQTPIHYQTEKDKLYDDEWCPAWLDLIMSP